MIFVETELYRSINKYNSQISDNRFYEFVHLIFILLIYEVLLLFSYNPHVLAYNGVDAWFKFSQAVIPHGTLFVSLFLIINWGNYVRLDWIGEKDRHELRKDYDEKKKNKKFKIITLNRILLTLAGPLHKPTNSRRITQTNCHNPTFKIRMRKIKRKMKKRKITRATIACQRKKRTLKKKETHGTEDKQNRCTKLQEMKSSQDTL